MTLSLRTVLRTGVALMALTLLSACDYLGVEPASKAAAQREQEGKAVGGACRHAGRAIEDCYVYNDGVSRAAIFEGWREMNDYMVQNKIEIVKPETTPQLAKHEESASGTDETVDPLTGEAHSTEKPAEKTAALSPVGKRGPPKPLGSTPVLPENALSKSAEKSDAEHKDE